jgi:hypothetical protein
MVKFSQPSTGVASNPSSLPTRRVETFHNLSFCESRNPSQRFLTECRDGSPQCPLLESSGEHLLVARFSQFEPERTCLSRYRMAARCLLPEVPEVVDFFGARRSSSSSFIGARL